LPHEVETQSIQWQGFVAEVASGCRLPLQLARTAYWVIPAVGIMESLKSSSDSFSASNSTCSG
jgi:hypothetical protein